jgi:ethanolamine utilization microcompartment shell protein EutS
VKTAIVAIDDAILAADVTVTGSGPYTASFPVSGRVSAVEE